MTDIVERLRMWAGSFAFPPKEPGAEALLHEAADEIERLLAAIRDAHGLIDNDLVVPWTIAHKLDDVLSVHKPLSARAALEPKP